MAETKRSLLDLMRGDQPVVDTNMVLIVTTDGEIKGVLQGSLEDTKPGINELDCQTIDDLWPEDVASRVPRKHSQNRKKP